jgi:hypothetical protein
MALRLFHPSTVSMNPTAKGGRTGDMNVAIDKKRWSTDLAGSGGTGGQDGNDKGSRSQGSLALNAPVPRPTGSYPDHGKLSELAD